MTRNIIILLGIFAIPIECMWHSNLHGTPGTVSTESTVIKKKIGNSEEQVINQKKDKTSVCDSLMYYFMINKENFMEPNTKKINVEVPENFYKLIKMYCVQHDITMRKLIMESVEQRLKTSENVIAPN